MAHIPIPNVIRRTIRDIRWIKRQIPYIVHANDINGYLDVPALENRVNIFNYNPEKLGYNLYNKQPFNLGDTLGKVIVTFLLEQKGIDVNAYIPQKKHLLAVGSNIIGGEEFGRYNNATVWGSGVMLKPTRAMRLAQKLSCRKLDIRAVRGPLTHEVVIGLGHKCPKTYGDPAILMPLFFHPKIEKKRSYSIIPQFYHECKFREKYPDEFCVSMNTNDYQSVISEILSSELIYTSSLHGIILAEAYGIPAVFFRGLGKNIDFKYLDYYASTERRDIKIAESLEEAMHMEPLPVPDFSKMQQGLLDTFPYDLWEP